MGTTCQSRYRVQRAGLLLPLPLTHTRGSGQQRPQAGVWIITAGEITLSTWLLRWRLSKSTSRYTSSDLLPLNLLGSTLLTLMVNALGLNKTDPFQRWTSSSHDNYRKSGRKRWICNEPEWWLLCSCDPLTHSSVGADVILEAKKEYVFIPATFHPKREMVFHANFHLLSDSSKLINSIVTVKPCRHAWFSRALKVLSVKVKQSRKWKIGWMGRPICWGV